MELCRIKGYIRDAANRPLEGVLLYAHISDFPAIDSTSQYFVHNSNVQAVSDETGFVEMFLIKNMVYDIVIRSTGYYGRLKAPGAGDLAPATAGYQEIQNVSDMGKFEIDVVPGIPTQTYALNVKVDNGAWLELEIPLEDTFTWGAVATAIQTVLRTASGNLEEVSIVNNRIRITSETLGSTSYIEIGSGTAVVGGGDLLDTIDFLSDDYETNLRFSIAGTDEILEGNLWELLNVPAGEVVTPDPEDIDW